MVLNTFPENFSNFYLFKTADDKINIENEFNKKVLCSKFALTTQQQELKGAIMSKKPKPVDIIRSSIVEYLTYIAAKVASNE